MFIPPLSMIFTVSRLNKTVRELLEEKINQIWLTGEISNFSQPTSGHWYFTLKDNCAQVRCAMFRSSNRRITFQPNNGQQVLVFVSITLYEPRGDYQLIAESIRIAGDGILQQQFEKLRQQLSNEGLFDKKYKQLLPSPGCKVGVITSTNGAALYDILQVLKRRDPLLQIIIYPTLVQGVEAPEQIVHAIKIANNRAECDVLIISRGGGSLEDLASFNDERVARAIFVSNLPIVSAIGHETDVTIADLVADLRAPTPSVAAELVSRNQVELLHQLTIQQQRLEMAMDYLYKQYQHQYNCMQYRLRQQHPKLQMIRQHNLLINFNFQLHDNIQRQLLQIHQHYEHLRERLLYQVPLTRINRAQQCLQTFIYQLNQKINNLVSIKNNTFIKFYSRLESINPKKILVQGFSITTDRNGKTIKQISQLNIGDYLTTHLSDGQISSIVTDIIYQPKK